MSQYTVLARSSKRTWARLSVWKSTAELSHTLRNHVEEVIRKADQDALCTACAGHALDNCERHGKVLMTLERGTKLGVECLPNVDACTTD
jgi:hypothetical protein